MRTKFQKKVLITKLSILTCSAIYIGIFIIMAINNRSISNAYEFLGYQIPIVNINGILNAVLNFLCIIMVLQNTKQGIRISNFLMICSVIYLLFVVLRTNVFQPLAGIMNTLIIMFSVNLIAKQLKYRQIESVTDYLSGLVNRRGLVYEIDKRINTKKPFYILHIGLDDFKYINNNYGHRNGDYILIQMADRLRNLSTKNSLVGHLGGDEFVMILPGTIALDKTIRELQETIGERLYLAKDYKDVYFQMTACIGVVEFPKDALTRETLTKYADISFYHAKQNGKNSVFIFDQTIVDKLDRATKLEQMIKIGLERNDFYLVLQPQFITRNKTLRGFETLIRYRPSNGEENIMPGEFIPIAEKTDLILHLDEYVIKNALMQMKEIIDETSKHYILSVNVSTKSICRYDFADIVKDALAVTGFPAECLEIEITEYCLASALDIAIKNITLLKELGIKIALDDFGTGYASLGYLTKLSIDLLKIDKSFIDDVICNEKSRNFINAVVSIGHVYGCEVVSEGVEKEEQLIFLNDAGCDFIQGYVWGKPIPFDSAKKLAIQEAKKP